VNVLADPEGMKGLSPGLKPQAESFHPFGISPAVPQGRGVFCTYSSPESFRGLLPSICPLRDRFDWLAPARAVRNLNAVNVCLDGSGLHCVIGFGQGLLELVWNDLILNKLLEIRRQFGL